MKNTDGYGWRSWKYSTSSSVKFYGSELFWGFLIKWLRFVMLFWFHIISMKAKIIQTTGKNTTTNRITDFDMIWRVILWKAIQTPTGVVPRQNRLYRLCLALALLVTAPICSNSTNIEANKQTVRQLQRRKTQTITDFTTCKWSLWGCYAVEIAWEIITRCLNSILLFVSWTPNRFFCCVR